MNYLAHVFLAENDPLSLLGNLMADVLKKSEFDKLPPGVLRGVKQHRQIDSFTDRHPVVLRSIRRLPPVWGWFGGIIIDVHCDYLLTQSWAKYSEEPFRDFCDRMNDTIREQLDEMPAESRILAERLIERDVFFSYSTKAGIEFALEKVSERIIERMPKLRIRLQDSMPELAGLHDLLLDDFREFFPQLMEFNKNWIAKTEPVVVGI